MNGPNLQNRANHNGFRWMEADAYLFDIDGTLLTSRDRVHRDALYRALREVYADDSTIDGVSYHGKTDPAILRAVLERKGIAGVEFEARLPEALAVMRRDAVCNANHFAPKLCPGVLEVLEFLRAAGKLLGVASGNLELIGWRKLEAAGLRKFFAFGAFSDHHELREQTFRQGVAEVRRRLGERATVCFVGDTPEDIRAARLADARVIAVATGIFKLEDLALHGPDLWVGSCAELLPGE